MVRKYISLAAFVAVSAVVSASAPASVLVPSSSSATDSVEVGHHGPWSLEECVTYALDHNITVKQQDISARSAELDLNTALNSRLPDLNANASESVSFGRGLSSQNTYVNKTTTGTSMNLGTSVPIFQGFSINRTIKMNQLNLQAATQDLEKAKDDIRVAVAQAYVQILYDTEIMDVANRQIEIDSLQVIRLEAMVSSGKASVAELSQQKATLAKSRLTAAQAMSSLNLALLDLSQLLELPSPESFSVVIPEVSAELALISNPEDIYAQAVAAKPSVKAEMFRLDRASANVNLAKSSLYPTLSLSGGIGSNYYKVLDVSADAFFTQLSNNFSPYVSLSLSIPIFTRFATRNNIRSAELARQNQSLQLESVKKTLYKEIQQAYYNALAAQTKLSSSKEAMKSAEDAFVLVKAKYENGKSNITEFNESKNSFLESDSNYVQAQFEYLYQTKLLDFYKGLPLKF